MARSARRPRGRVALDRGRSAPPTHRAHIQLVEHSPQVGVAFEVEAQRALTLSTVALFVPHRPALFELGLVHEVFGVDRSDDGAPRFDFVACSERPGESIELPDGMTMTTPHGLDSAEDADLLVAPAFDYAHPVSGAVLDTFRRAHARGAWVVSVCSGAFLLGAASLARAPRIGATPMS